MEWDGWVQSGTSTGKLWKQGPRDRRILLKNVDTPLAHLVQEYYELVKKEDAYVAVERNTAGSRPKELFEDIVEEVDAAYDADRTVLKASRWGDGRGLCHGSQDAQKSS